MSRGDSLSGRLSRLKKDGLAPPVHDLKTQSSQNKTSLPGWREDADCFWSRKVEYPNPLPDSFTGSLLIPEDWKSENLIFYDTETTGLSTGAGTIPFLIGFGRLKGETFSITQYFLSDYPGEKALMEQLKRDFSGDVIFVSYNGKSYDSHLINTRFLMNGIPVNPRKEVDLLYMSRRLWKNRLSDCRLGTVEEKILSLKRGADIPGGEIPDVWFDFLKNGATEKLELVFSHNLQDIHTLTFLLAKLEEIISGNGTGLEFDRFALGKFLLINGKNEGIMILRKEWEKGDRRAGIFLSLFLKRAGQWSEAVHIWEQMNSRGNNIFSIEELAKYYEHKMGLPEKALSLVDGLLKSPYPLSEEIREKLVHRRKRLIEKR